MGVTHVAVVPFSRPERQAGVQALIDANPDVQFVVAGNGRGVGCDFARAVLLETPLSAGAARNVGIDWAREHGFGFVSFVDDDDYYGPGYFAEARAALETYDVVHKGLGFVRLPTGLYMFRYRTAREYMTMIGNSISARVAACPRFSEHLKGEEFGFTREARARGLREAALPPFGFVYDRSAPGGHAYACSSIQFLRAHGPAAFLGDLPDSAVDLLPLPSDEDVFRDMESRARAIR